MKKLLTLLTLSIVLFSSLSYAALGSDNVFTDETLKYEIKGPSGWTPATDRRGRSIVFSKGDGISEISVMVFTLDARSSDAEDVAKNQYLAYDGWQYVAGRILDWNERRGADTAFSAMYEKNILRQATGSTKIIVQEGYFVKGRKAYVITLMTDKNKWSSVKDELLFSWNSFSLK